MQENLKLAMHFHPRMVAGRMQMHPSASTQPSIPPSKCLIGVLHPDLLPTMQQYTTQVDTSPKYTTVHCTNYSRQHYFWGVHPCAPPAHFWKILLINALPIQVLRPNQCSLHIWICNVVFSDFTWIRIWIVRWMHVGHSARIQGQWTMSQCLQLGFGPCLIWICSRCGKAEQDK